jgi:hypothetical protein
MDVSQVAEELNAESGRDEPLVSVVGNEPLVYGWGAPGVHDASNSRRRPVRDEMGTWAEKINWFSGGGFHVSVDVKGIRFSQSL